MQPKNGFCLSKNTLQFSIYEKKYLFIIINKYSQYVALKSLFTVINYNKMEEAILPKIFI